MPKAVVISVLGIGLAVIVALIIFWSVSKYLKKQLTPELSNQPLTNGQDASWDEKRRQARMAVSWQASMETSQGTVPVQLKNISHSGAFVVCPEPRALNEKFRMNVFQVAG